MTTVVKYFDGETETFENSHPSIIITKDGKGKGKLAIHKSRSKKLFERTANLSEVKEVIWKNV